MSVRKIYALYVRHTHSELLFLPSGVRTERKTMKKGRYTCNVHQDPNNKGNNVPLSFNTHHVPLFLFFFLSFRQLKASFLYSILYILAPFCFSSELMLHFVFSLPDVTQQLLYAVRLGSSVTHQRDGWEPLTFHFFFLLSLKISWYIIGKQEIKSNLPHQHQKKKRNWSDSSRYTRTIDSFFLKSKGLYTD